MTEQTKKLQWRYERRILRLYILAATVFYEIWMFSNKYMYSEMENSLESKINWINIRTILLRHCSQPGSLKIVRMP